MLGGVQQTVAVTKGQTYQAGAWVQAWTSSTDDPCKNDGQMIATVGLDPYGGSDPWAQRVIWQEWRDANPGCGQWFEVVSPVVKAESDHVTFFVRFQHRWALKHGDGYLEDAWLREVQAGTCPECPACPTPTPCPDCPACPDCPTQPVDCLTQEEYNEGQSWLLAQVEALLRRLTLLLE